ncbi:hypothetical protein J6590_066517 [Homalodisca vitripennis]|nr:hypothetical protein J6590_066517 [Homalodisca vitripennis]
MVYCLDWNLQITVANSYPIQTNKALLQDLKVGCIRAPNRAGKLYELSNQRTIQSPTGPLALQNYLTSLLPKVDYRKTLSYDLSLRSFHSVGCFHLPSLHSKIHVLSGEYAISQTTLDYELRFRGGPDEKLSTYYSLEDINYCTSIMYLHLDNSAKKIKYRRISPAAPPGLL